MNDCLVSSVLIVDDDSVDILFTERAIVAAGLTLQVVSALSGEKALEYLRGVIERAEPLPALILLDIKMPGMDGFDCLAAIRAVPALSGVRVVMHSSSDDPSDIALAHRLGACDYVRKYPSADRLRSLLSV